MVRTFASAAMRALSMNNPKHWRDRAQETRALAGKIDDPKAKQTLLETAEGYDRLAKRAEERKTRSAHNKTPRD